MPLSNCEVLLGQQVEWGEAMVGATGGGGGGWGELQAPEGSGSLPREVLILPHFRSARAWAVPSVLSYLC